MQEQKEEQKGPNGHIPNIQSISNVHFHQAEHT